jgi:hypothetical protein
MRESEQKGVQAEAPEGVLGAAVGTVPGDRMAGFREVDSNLVLPPRFQRHLECGQV